VQLLVLLLLDVLIKNSGDAFLKEVSSDKPFVDDLGALAKSVLDFSFVPYDARSEAFYIDLQQYSPFDAFETAPKLDFCF
jgi:hypothetical protein